MSVQTQIDRINSAKTAIGAAIAGKGVTVPSGTKIDGMAALVEAIQAGGGSGGTHENCIPYEEAGFSFSVDAIDGAQYGFALNSAGYYESQNKGVNTSYALCRVNLTVNKACNVEFSVINFAESNYDYGLFGALDTALNKNTSADSNVKKSFKSENSANAVSLVYENVPAGSHFIDVKFIKDSSQNKGNDSLQFKVIVDDTVTISPEYYPIISRTDPVIDALAAIFDKGVDTTGAGFEDIAALVAGIKVAEEGNVFEITPAQTGIIYPDVNVEDDVRGVICLRVNAYPENSPAGDGSVNVDAGDVPFCASILSKKYRNNGTQYRMAVYNASNSYYSAEVSKSNAAINANTKADSDRPCAFTYTVVKNQRLSLYVNSPGSRGLRVGATYRVVLL